MRARFIGDPAERAAAEFQGRSPPQPGLWFELPSDPELAKKIIYNDHYEVEGATVIAPKRTPKPKPAPAPAKIETDGWEEDE